MQLLIRQILIFTLLTATFSGCTHYLAPAPCPDPLPPFYVPDHIRVALVLGSGGVRGMAHVGVIEELVAADIPIDLIVGCSAGSVVGALYADNPDVGALVRTLWQRSTRSLLDFDFWNCRYGLSQPTAFWRVLSHDLCARTFEELSIPLVVVATDLCSGELVPIGSGDLVMALQASSSIPLVFVPCQYKGRILVDGGIVDPVPVQLARELGAEVVIAVDLAELLPSTCPTNLFSIIQRSADISSIWHNERCAQTADVVIQPKVCGVGTFNDRLKSQLYCAGRQAARAKISAILDKIKQKTTPDEGLCGWRLVEPECYAPRIYDCCD